MKIDVKIIDSAWRINCRPMPPRAAPDWICAPAWMRH
jgi:hypothetical protein